jgi:prepilin-type N-terminal cleavage/methylation domain-containing protein
MRKAFTLVELLVVVAIIAMIIAILLPSLNRARYLASISVCASQMHQMSVGITSYTTDFRGKYPDGAWGRPNPAVIFWNGSNGNHTTGGEGDFNFRPVFRQYFGTDLNRIMKCPLASSWWKDDSGLSNIDDTGPHAGMVKTPFAFYFGQECHTLHGPLGGKADHKWDRAEHMTRIGQTWSPVSNSSLQFSVVISDVAYWNGHGGEYLLTSHRAPNGGVPEGGNWTDHNMGYTYGYGQEANANFAKADGSVTTEYFSLASIDDRTLTGIRRQVGHQSYLIPTALGQ